MTFQNNFLLMIIFFNFINVHKANMNAIQLFINKIVDIFFMNLINVIRKILKLSKKIIRSCVFFVEYMFYIEIKNLIHINQRKIKIFKKSAIKRLNCVIKIFTLILMMNRTLYNQKRIFFNAFKRL